MTDQQINAAIAEACGWGWFQKVCTGELLGKPIKEQGPLRSILDYCTDLNAMHEAENMLIEGFEDEPESSELWSDYQTNLIIACPAYLSYHATARQRAEAFLRTLGKWSATTEDSLTVEATTEESSVDHLRDATKMIRAQAAIAAMQGHIVHRGFSENGKHVADLAIRHADALIAALKNEVQL